MKTQLHIFGIERIVSGKFLISYFTVSLDPEIEFIATKINVKITSIGKNKIAPIDQAIPMGKRTTVIKVSIIGFWLKPNAPVQRAAQEVPER